jgi:cytochrome c oxidase cbb3-type subunit IV
MVDANDLRALGTLLAFLTFIGIVVWAYSRSSRSEFDEAERLPFAESDLSDLPDRKPRAD